VIDTLLRDDSGTVSDATKVFLRDCNDHVTQVIDITESFRDLTAGLMDVYHSSLGFRTNEIMRVLTLVSTFFIPLTFLAGVYGMNFSTESPWNMPELHWTYGYPAFWTVAVLIGIGMFVFFRRKSGSEARSFTTLPAMTDMISRRPILILTSAFGEGHNAAARNLATSLRALDPGRPVEVRDLFAEAYGGLYKVAQKAYFLFINHFPGLWGLSTATSTGTRMSRAGSQSTSAALAC